DVRHLCAARTHAGERFVAGRINKHDGPAVLFDVVRADVLRDSTRFLFGDVGRTDRIQQRSLSVIDVTHDRHHGRTTLAVLFYFTLHNSLARFLFVTDVVGRRAEIARQFFGQLHIERLVDGRENFLLHQAFHDHVALNAELFRKLLYGDAFGDGDLAI